MPRYNVTVMAEETHFIGTPISVEFDTPPALEKRPHCPSRFLWDGSVYPIVALLSEWADFERRGRMAQNMRPENAQRARMRGSWGVGRYFFRVRVADDRIFDIYYDRAPQGSDNRKGTWHLFRQILAQ